MVQTSTFFTITDHESVIKQHIETTDHKIYSSCTTVLDSSTLHKNSTFVRACLAAVDPNLVLKIRLNFMFNNSSGQSLTALTCSNTCYSWVCFNGPIMSRVTLLVVRTIHTQTNKFVTSVKIKETGTALQLSMCIIQYKYYKGTCRGRRIFSLEYISWYICNNSDMMQELVT